MNTLLKLLLASSVVITLNLFAETVYLNGEAVDQKVINKTFDQYKKYSPMAALQMNNSQFKKQILHSIGMEQAMLAEGNKEQLDKIAGFQQIVSKEKAFIYLRILAEKASSNVTDAEILAKYNELKANPPKKQYRASHIVVEDEKTADIVLEELKKGVQFSDLVGKYSIAIRPDAEDKSGDLGWIDDGANLIDIDKLGCWNSFYTNYIPEISEALSKLNKGQYTTTAVRTQYGFHIIKLNDERNFVTKPIVAFDSMKDQLKQEIQVAKTRQFYMQFFGNLHPKYKGVVGVQYILAEGDKQQLDKTTTYQDKIEKHKPIIYGQLLREKAVGNITDAELLTKYNQLKANPPKKQYRASHIVVEDEKTADIVLEGLKKGIQFSDLVEKYSIAIKPNAEDNSGDLGWIDDGANLINIDKLGCWDYFLTNYVPEISQALAELDKGQYTTTAVKTQYGFHIIQLNDERTIDIKPIGTFDSMKDQLRQEIEMERSREFFARLKDKYKIEVK
jgi:peptidyl-prolyl cis-trans isomerase C